MPRQKQYPLDAGYSAEIDRVNERDWYWLMNQFNDSNLNQTWAYGAAMSGPCGIHHLVLSFENEVVALAQVRIKELPPPFIGCGIAYVGWGPMWQRKGREPNIEHFRKAIRALRNEFVCRCKYDLRIFPLAFDDDPYGVRTALAKEGFQGLLKQKGDRTLLVDVSPDLDALRKGLEGNWRRCLRNSENNDFEIVEGKSEEMIEGFMAAYAQLIERKQFALPSTYLHLKEIQERLPEEMKMKVSLCRSAEGVCAGLVVSTLGKMGIDLYAATTDLGMHNFASYLVRWKMLEEMKQCGMSIYNLNGINPETNPGTYRFKRGLAYRNGRDVYYLGRFDATPGFFHRVPVKLADQLRKEYLAARSKLARMKARVRKRKARSEESVSAE